MNPSDNSLSKKAKVLDASIKKQADLYRIGGESDPLNKSFSDIIGGSITSGIPATPPSQKGTAYDTILKAVNRNNTRQDKAWSEDSELDDLWGNAKQLLASGIQGWGRIGNEIVAGIDDLQADNSLRKTSQDARDIYFRRKAIDDLTNSIGLVQRNVRVGKLSPEEADAQITELKRKRAQIPSPTDQELSSLKGLLNPENIYDRRTQEEALDDFFLNVASADRTRDLFDKSTIGSIANSVRQEGAINHLQTLNEDNAPNWDKGFGELGSGQWKEGASTLAGALGTTLGDMGETALEHPMGILDLMVEDLGPQIVAGLFGGKEGAIALQALSSGGEALRAHNEGIKEFIKENQRLPSSKEHLGMIAGTVAYGAADAVGDYVAIGKVLPDIGDKVPAPVSSNPIAAAAARVAGRGKDIATAAVAEGITGTAQGVLSETLLKGNYDTSEINTERVLNDGTLEALVGGAAGVTGATAKTVKEVAEVPVKLTRKASEEKIANHEAKVKKYSDAVDSGDLSSITKVDDTDYDLDAVLDSAQKSHAKGNTDAIQAVRKVALAHHNKAEKLREELSDDVLAGIKDQNKRKQHIQSVQKDIKLHSEAADKATSVFTKLKEESRVDQESADSQVAEIMEGDQNSPVDKVSAQRLIRSIADSPERYSDKDLGALAQSNRLSSEHRDYLSSVVRSRKAAGQYETLQNTREVSSNIINGGRDKTTGNYFKGLRTYRFAFDAALAEGDYDEARSQLSDLKVFADRHTDKAKVFAAAARPYRVQVESGDLHITPQDRQAAEHLKSVYGGAYVKGNDKSLSLVESIESEAEMLTAAYDELNKLVRAVDPLNSPQEGTESRSETNTDKAVVSDPDEPSVSQKAAEEVSQQPEVKKPHNAIPDESPLPQKGKGLQGNTVSDLESRQQQIRGNIQQRQALLMDDIALEQAFDSDKDSSIDDFRQRLKETNQRDEKRVRSLDQYIESEKSIDEVLDTDTDVVRDITTPSDEDKAHWGNQDLSAKERFFGTNPIKRFYSAKDDTKAASLNPLRVLPDFQAALEKSPTMGFLRKFIDGDVSDKEFKVMKDFSEFNKSLSRTLTGKVFKASEFYDKPYNHLRDSNGDIPANVVTAMSASAYNWLSVNGGSTLFNRDETINKVYGRDSYSRVTPIMRDLLQSVGVLEGNVARQLGQDTLSMLDLKESGNNPDGSFHEKLAIDIGNQILAALYEDHYLERNQVSSEQMEKALPDRDSSPFKALYIGDGKEALPITFTRVRSQTGVNDSTGLQVDIPYDSVQHIMDVNQGTGGFFGRLLSTERSANRPELVPPSKVRKSDAKPRKVVGNDQRASEENEAHLRKVEDQPVVVNTRMHSLFDFFTDKENAIIAGAHFSDPGSQIDSAQKREDNKNEGILRGIAAYKDHVAWLDNDLEKPTFFRWNMWKSGRVGMVGEVNMQQNKLHRHLLMYQDWWTDLDISDESPDNVQAFFHGVAQSQGVKVDGLTREAIDQQFQSLLEEGSSFMKGVRAVQSIQKSADTLTTDSRNKLVNDVLEATKEGGENYFSLHGLSSYAAYLTAKESGETTFKNDMIAEVDGKTNGPILGMIQLSAAGSARELLQGLRKGAIYSDGETTSFGEWTQHSRHNLDAYQELAKNWGANVQKQYNIAKQNHDYKFTSLMESVEGVLGKLIVRPDTDAVYTVSKDGRNLSKDPLMTNVYGSSVGAIVQRIGNTFIDKWETELNDAFSAKDLAKANELAGVLNTVGNLKGEQVIQFGSLEEVKSFTIPSWVEKKLIMGVREVHGEPLDAAVQNTWGHFTENREVVNHSVAAANSIFNVLYRLKTEQKIDQLEKDGEFLPEYMTLGKSEEKAIIDGLLDSYPILHTFHSQKTGDLREGIDLSKRTKKVAFDANGKAPKSSKVESSFGNAIKVRNSKGEETTLKTLSGNARVTAFEDTGVGSTVGGIHNTDSMIMVPTMGNHISLGVHDGLLLPTHASHEGATTLNRNTQDVMVGFSIPEQSNALLQRSIELIKSQSEEHSLVDLGELLAQEMGKTKTLGVFQKENGSITNGWITLEALQKESEALLDREKLVKDPALKQVTAWNQYTHVDGAVTADKPNSVPESRQVLPPRFTLDRVKDVASRWVEEAIKQGREENVPLLLNYKNPEVLELLRVVKDLKNSTESTLEGTLKQLHLNPVMHNKLVKGLQEVESMFDRPVYSSRSALYELFQGEVTVPELIDVLRSGIQGKNESLNKGYKFLLKALESRVPKDTKVVTVRSEGDLTNYPEKVRSELLNSRAVWDNASRTMYVKGTEFSPQETGVRAETLIHELIHTVITDRLHKKRPSAQLKQTLKELESVRSSVVSYMKKHGINPGQFGNAVDSVDELIAWGLTNKRFMALLKQVEMKEPVTKRIVSGFKRFLDAVLKGFFGHTGKSTVPNNALEHVLHLSSQVMSERYGTSRTSEIFSQKIVDESTDLTSEELFDALDSVGNTRTSETNKSHIRELLSNTINRVVGPYGSQVFKAKDNMDSVDVFLDHVQNSEPVVLTSAMANGYRLSAQEAYVLEQIDAITRSGLGHHSEARRELNRLWQAASNQLEVRDFMDDPSVDMSDPVNAPAVKAAKQRHDYLFKLTESSNSGLSDRGNKVSRSEYLNRFIALASVHEPLRAALGKVQIKKETDVSEMTVSKQVLYWVGKVVDLIESWFNPGTEIRKGSDAEKLIGRLASISVRKQGALVRALGSVHEKAETITNSWVNKVKDNLDKAGQSDTFRKSRSGVIRATGALTSTIAGNRTEAVMLTFRDAMTRYRKGKQTEAHKLANEVLGQNDGNIRFYELQREANHNIDQARKHVSNWLKRVLTQGFGKKLSEDESVALTKAIIKTDLSSLVNQHSLQQIEKWLRESKEAKKRIDYLNKELDKLPANLSNYYKIQSELLGRYMAQGISTKALNKNPHAIAYVYGTDVVSVESSVADTAKPIIDELASMWAMQYTEGHHRKTAADVIRDESNRGEEEGNGVLLMLNVHNEMKQESKASLFKGDESLMQKGYTKEITNPHVAIQAAPLSAKPTLEAQGYVMSDQPLNRDSSDPSKEPLYLFRAEDQGLPRYLSGILSLTSRKAKGTKLQGPLESQDGTTISSSVLNRKLMQDAQQDIQYMLTPGQTSQRFLRERASLDPIVNPQGEFTGFRYVMQESTKDDLLDKHNDVFEIMGNLGSSIIDKDATLPNNEKVIEALHEQYKEDFDTRFSGYREIGPDSKDERLREIYYMFPRETRNHIENVWGGKSMLVREDLIDMVFGYRKVSMVSDFWEMKPDNAFTKYAQSGVISLAERIFGKNKALMKLRKGENAWMELIREVKDIFVIRSFFTLANNFISNLSVLYVAGVPLSQTLKHHKEGYNGILEYQEAQEKLFILRTNLEHNQMDPYKRRQTENRIVQLENELATNPVKVLVDEGVFQSIIEDIEQESDPFSYKTKFAQKLEGYTDNLPEVVKSTGKTVTVAQDTKLYKWLNQSTQVSDFVARYVLYKHLTERKKDAVEHRDAINQIMKTFVVYDTPTSRTIQYLNDVGLLMFTKYYLRIQRVILEQFRENPARMMALLFAQNQVDFTSISDSSILERGLGNPFNNPVESLIRAPGEIVTLNAASNAF